MNDRTIAALATPQGVGGIAVVRISGEDACSMADKIFVAANKSKTLSMARGYTAMFGHFISKKQVRDEVVALVFRAPHSYTGEDVVELSCHGGSVITSAILHELYSLGVEPATRGEFTKRAFLSGRISLTEAEAVMEVINSSSVRALKSAEAALAGSVYKEIQRAQKSLLELAGHIAAYTDYPEEDVEELEPDKILNCLNFAKTVLEGLIDNYGKGALIKNGINAAIIGSPNVGKSTLLNLLSGFDRAIVSNVAGTTRDVIEQEISIGDIKLLVKDTAGIRETSDFVEAEGIKRSFVSMEQAELVLVVFDNAAKITRVDIDIAVKCKEKKAIAIINKCDLSKNFNEEEIQEYFSNIISISATQSKYVEQIEQTIVDVLQLNKIDDENTAVLANERQYTAAKKALHSLNDAISAQKANITLDAVGVCNDEALGYLYELTGENVSEAVVDEVFEKFCVGK